MSGRDDQVTAYARGSDGFVGYRTRGHGAAIVYVASWGISFEGLAESPWWEVVARRLATLGQVVVFDKRGTGVSDPLPYSINENSEFAPTIEEAVRDLVTVLDDLGEEQCIVVATFAASPVAIAFSALHPHRTRALILIDPVPRLMGADPLPSLGDTDVRTWAVETFRSSWGVGA